VGRLRRHLAESGAAFASIARNRDLRLLNLALAASCVGHWSYAVAVSVYAYHEDGATAVGLVWLVRMIPAAVTSPFTGVLADRYPRRTVLVIADLARFALMGGAAAAMATHAPLAIVIVMAAAISLVATPAEPAFAGLMPQLATTPVELTAANVASSAIQSVGFFAGPALGGALLAASGPAAATVVTAGLVLASAALTVRIPPKPVERPGVRFGEIAAEVSEGLGAIGREQRLPPLIGLLAATTLVDGALEVLVVVVAIRLTGLGNAGVGYLNAGFGIGALAGAALSTLLGGTRRLSVPFVFGILLWGVPIALLAIPAPAAVAVALLGVVGLGQTFFDVAGTTLVQRAVPVGVISRVFGVLQSLWLGAIGIGAALAPVLVRAVGIRPALVATGLFLPALVVVLGVRLLRIDAATPAPERSRLELLQSIALFAPLSTLALEQLARQLEPVRFGPGDAIIREGEAGDRFYAIAEGEVEVTTGGRFVAALGPGDYVGEIALLRSVPRTATVTARSAVSAFALDRGDFLSAVAGSDDAARVADAAVGSRLAGLRAVQRKSRLGV
jgi:predicted MFS family arabinose efflux permease